MLAVDANVLIRFLTRDDIGQAARAARVLSREEVWLAKTVLLETEWVLRSLYSQPAHIVASALRKLLGLPRVRVEDPRAVAKALDWVDSGLDFADALHLASCGESTAFATFDERFAKRAPASSQASPRSRSDILALLGSPHAPHHRSPLFIPRFCPEQAW